MKDSLHKAHSVSDLDQWFITNVLTLDRSLTTYLRRQRFENSVVEDVRQEVYVRVYDAARFERPRNVRSFVYATARNLMRDQVRRARIVSIEAVADMSTLSESSSDLPADNMLISREEFRLFVQALESLPERCREVITLRKVEGLSQKETARRMGIAEDTVERQTLIGMRRLVSAMEASSHDSGWFLNRKSRKAK